MQSAASASANTPIVEALRGKLRGGEKMVPVSRSPEAANSEQKRGEITDVLDEQGAPVGRGERKYLTVRSSGDARIVDRDCIVAALAQNLGDDGGVHFVEK